MRIKKMDSLLSIVIPNHNYGRFVEDAIRSVAQQNYAPIELIVVDDASSDNSVDVIDNCLSQVTGLARVEFVANSESQGKLGVMNRTLPLIQGEYYIALDADDYLAEDYARRCVEALEPAKERDDGVGFVYTDCNLIAEDGRWLAPGRSTAFDADLLSEWSFIPSPAVVLTQAMIEATPFDESIKKGTKHHTWQRIVGAGWKGVHLPEALFCYRMHGRNVSGIGDRVLSEVDNGRKDERILSGYWPTALT